VSGCGTEFDSQLTNNNLFKISYGKAKEGCVVVPEDSPTRRACSVLRCSYLLGTQQLGFHNLSHMGDNEIDFSEANKVLILE
jgi:hypothetical protein